MYVDKSLIIGVTMLVCLLSGLLWLATEQHAECQAKKCPDGMSPTVVHGQCLCVVLPK